ncbi:MAG: ribbon-helix-helix domain-containing protein [Acidimicrobiales bacterium]
MTQLAIRLPDEVMADLDALVAAGSFSTRTEAVRAAIVAMIDAERRRSVGHAIADGYRRTPQTDDEVTAAEHAAITSIHEEPW